MARKKRNKFEDAVEVETANQEPDSIPSSVFEGSSFQPDPSPVHSEEVDHDMEIKLKRTPAKYRKFLND